MLSSIIFIYLEKKNLCLEKKLSPNPKNCYYQKYNNKLKNKIGSCKYRDVSGKWQKILKKF